MPATPYQYDYLIIGQGLAGSLLAWELIQRNAKVLVIDNGQENASQIAAGLINPITGMRLVKSTDVDTLLPVAKNLYRQLGQYFQKTFYIEKPMLRFLRTENESNYAQKRVSDPAYQDYLDTILPQSTRYQAPYGLLQQCQTGYLLTRSLLTCLKRFFIEKKRYLCTHMDYRDINPGLPGWRDITCKGIIFCEGYLVTNNPWFNHLPFQPVKGEILTVSLPEHGLSQILNYGHWLIPLDANNLRVGATFDRDNLNTLPTETGKRELLDSLQSCGKPSAEVIKHQANIRPGTKDKQPFIGRHPSFSRLLLFNGFGAKGSLQIPWYSQRFADYLLNQTPLPAHCCLQR